MNTLQRFMAEQNRPATSTLADFEKDLAKEEITIFCVQTIKNPINPCLAPVDVTLGFNVKYNPDGSAYFAKLIHKTDGTTHSADGTYWGPDTEDMIPRGWRRAHQILNGKYTKKEVMNYLWEIAYRRVPDKVKKDHYNGIPWGLNVPTKLLVDIN